MKEKLKDFLQDKTNIKTITAIFAVVIILVLVLVFVISKWGGRNDFEDLREEPITAITVETKTVVVTEADYTEPSFEMPDLSVNEMEYIVPKWDSELKYEAYGDLAFGYNAYSPYCATISEKYLDGLMGDCSLMGYKDIDATESYLVPCKIYKISAVSSDCAIAVTMEGEEGYHIFVNYRYSAMNIQTLLNDFGLKSAMVINKVYYKNSSGEEKIYTLEDKNKVYDILFRNGEAPNSLEMNYSDNPSVIISVSLPLMGDENISVALNDDGFLQTNVMGIANSFEIGKEVIDEFKSYLEKSCSSEDYSSLATGDSIR